MPLIVVVTESGCDGEAWVRRRLQSLADPQLDRILIASMLRWIANPTDPVAAMIARAAQDEYDRRGLIDGLRP